MIFEFPTAFASWHYGDGGPEQAAIHRVLASGRYTMGPETEAFEAEIAAYHGRRYAVATSSGSTANLVALGAIDVYGPRRATAAQVPAVAWATTYAPLVQLGYALKVKDVDDTWNAPEVGGRTELTVWVPVLGNPAPYDPPCVLADCCESLGARDEGGNLVGHRAFMSTGSAFFSHQISAIELGWVLTDDDALASACRTLRNHGNAGNPASTCFEEKYNFIAYGYNVRPVELHCAIARAQLQRLPELIAARRANLAHFRSLTEDLPVLHQRLAGDPSPFGLPFEVADPARRAPLVAALAAASIDARPPTGGSFLQHLYGAPWRQTQSTPRADLLHARGLFLGNAPYPIPHLIERAARVLRDNL